MNKKVLVVVDYQRDFVDPVAGSLYVPASEIVASIIQKEINDNSYDDIIYTMDTHVPSDYKGSEEAQLFPEHCVFNSTGWNLFKIRPRNIAITHFIEQNLSDIPTDFSVGNEFVFMKDQFSIWDGNPNYAQFIESRYAKNTEFVIVGVAFDFCVRFNATGYKDIGFNNVSVLVNATKGIAQESYDEAVKAMEDCKVKLIGGV